MAGFFRKKPELSNKPCGTIYDIHVSYDDGSSNPEKVFRSAVEKANKSKEQVENSSVEWIYVVSEKEIEAQLRVLNKLGRDYEKYPLYGIPFAVKDNIDVENVPTTVACQISEFDHKKEDSAMVVKRLKEAGALFVGKTNLDQFATGLVGTRSPYGIAKSAWNENYISGGSSSGSATVVARGIVPFALGTDTAGSGRVPAAFNGVVGLKPSLGRVSNVGVYPACESLDCVSVFSLTAPDAAVVLNVIESEAVEIEDVRYASPTSGPKVFKSFKIGVPKGSLPIIESQVSPSEFNGRFERFVEVWRQRRDAEIVEFDMEPLAEIARLLYQGPWLAERYSSFQNVMETHREFVDDTVYEIMSAAPEVTGVDTFVNGIHKLQRLRPIANKLWEDFNVILVPSTPHHPTIEQVVVDPVRVNAELGSYTNFVNFLGWSALAVPVNDDFNTPFGVTWIAPPGYEAALLDLACRYVGGEPKYLGAPSYGMSANPKSLHLPYLIHDALCKYGLSKQ